MNESKGRITEVQVGVLTIAAVAVLIVGMMWFKNLDFTRGSVTYFVDFPRVEGMQAGDRVQVRGIRMGEVQGLAMLPEAVRVEIMVEGETPLREDAEITLGEKGIVGEVVVDVEPGTTGKVVPPGYVFKGRTAGTIAAMTDAAGAALAEMRTLTGLVTDLVTEIREQGQVRPTHVVVAPTDCAILIRVWTVIEATQDAAEVGHETALTRHGLYLLPELFVEPAPLCRKGQAL